jgi:soluble lytic murein transglycosylase-like protein/lipopolysaccharide biosynthesis regulator YciM
MFSRDSDWAAAAAALDQAYAEDPAAFTANNLQYLRGRVAEQQGDWQRAHDEFARTALDNPLYTFAAWHAARAAVHLGQDAEAQTLLTALPRDFFPELNMQIAREAGRDLALKIYQDVASRQARFERAILLDDVNTLWSLVRETNNDIIALQAARRLLTQALTSQDLSVLAEVFMSAREFDAALQLYQQLANEPASAPAARYQIARVHFLRENYRLALETYHSIASDFAGTEWQENSEYQIAACYWRLAEYRDSEKAYLNYIEKYGRAGMEEGAVRNLVDVYRVLGENAKAVTWLDKMLARRISVATRQVYLFTKAKILYTQKRYTAALAIFQQLGKMRLRPAAGGTTQDEVDYFQALLFSKLSNPARARVIWNRLAADPLSYYGQRAAQALTRPPSAARPLPGNDGCAAADSTLQGAQANIERLRHRVRPATEPFSDAVSELIFLRLWDEAFLWMERYAERTDRRTAADLAYLAGRFDRAIAYADRLAKSDSTTLGLRYPAGFRQTICEAARTYKVDPLWLHAIIWQESRYNPNATSNAAARGLMQFIPETAKMVATAIGMTQLAVEDLYDPRVVIRLGASYWASLLEQAKYPEMALAAYNGGLGNVIRWKNKSPGSADELDLFVADIGFVETKRYVMAVFAARAAYGRLN